MILNYRSNCLYAGAILFNATNPLAVSLRAQHLSPLCINVRARLVKFIVTRDFG